MTITVICDLCNRRTVSRPMKLHNASALAYDRSMADIQRHLRVLYTQTVSNTSIKYANIYQKRLIKN